MLRDLPGNTVRLYREMGRRTVQLGMRKGTLSRERADAMLEVLAEGEYPLPGEEPPGEDASDEGGNGNQGFSEPLRN